ncbi:leucine-rich repeat, immunoglobulin-like domain-containing kekkon 5 protein isoform 1-T2 [Aphomia sociella]
MDRRTLRLLCALSLVLAVKSDFTSNCPQGCKCVWASGNKQANCSQSNLQNIPKTLSTDIQNLDLGYNPLYEISSNAFDDVQLINLKKLHLRDCKLQTIHRNGFSGLAIMIELDLSKNSLKTLHPETFRETSKIRWIILKDNLLEKLDDGLFSNLQFLQKVELSNNRIVQIGVKTFFNVPKLNTLELDGNKLEYIKVNALNSLSLSNLDVHDNPWRCDCYLQPFRNWVMSKHLYTSPISCNEPAKVQGKTWKDLDNADFACRPTIIYPSNSTTIMSSDNNITLACQVNGNPLPEVNWVLNAQIIDSSYRYLGEIKYDIASSNNDNSKWVNLTILDAGSTDNGEYLCVAKNQGGVEEKSTSLIVTHIKPDVIPPSGMDNSMLPVLIGITTTAAILLICLIILCYYCCRRRVSEKKKADVSNGEALIEGSVIPEMEKSLITAVNPVTKPPRRYDAPASITSGTELSELNRTLLDNDFVYAHNDDEKRSLGFDHISKRSHDALNVEYERTDGRTYPPDLLSFPPRAAQISPAASNASTVPDTTRLPPQLNPVSPIHSPIYGVANQNLFRTLPYSRSQSPFTAPITPPVVTPRQGYVTIPRRPRVPSWSSTASTQILPSAEAQEPLYDNLGLRTTADGSSVLSLNKAGLEAQFSPMRNRPLPATPTSFQPPHQVFYAPIEEQEPAPSPVPAQYATNPRNSISSQLSSQISTPGPQEPTSPRMSWTTKNTSTPQTEPRKTLFSNSDSKNMDGQSQASDTNTLSRKGNKPETGSLRRNPRTEKEEISSPSKDDTRKNENNVSLNQSGTLGRSGKIPPRPPPKPKKKPSTDANPTEPLFEEGEDGTEV